MSKPVNIYTPNREDDGSFRLSLESFERLHKTHSGSKIYKALENLEEERPKETVVSGDMTPCYNCGGIDFLRTGNCSVCTTCAESQGCS